MGNRDELWRVSWESYYDSYYYSILFSELSRTWQRFDFISRVLVAITASGSAVAGWALWENPEAKIIWIFVAGLASVISIFHTTLNTSERLKEYTKLSNEMSEIKLEFESLRNELSIYPDFDVNKYFKTHEKTKGRYKKVLSSYAPDFMTTESIQNKAQTLLNTRLDIKE